MSSDGSQVIFTSFFPRITFVEVQNRPSSSTDSAHNNEGRNSNGSERTSLDESLEHSADDKENQARKRKRSLLACPHCPFATDKRQIMKPHLNSHRRYRGQMVECDVCGVQFSHRPNMLRHRKSHGQKQHQCAVCKKEFFRIDQMKEHLKIHSRFPASSASVQATTSPVKHQPFAPQTYHGPQQQPFFEKNLFDQNLQPFLFANLSCFNFGQRF